MTPAEYSSYMAPSDDGEFRLLRDRIASNRFFRFFASVARPGADCSAVRAEFLALESMAEFQRSFMLPFIDSMLKATAGEVTFTSDSGLDMSAPHLYISNHRDIVVDPLLIEYRMMSCGLPTTDITIGNNLLSVSFLTDLACLNRIYRVTRDSVSVREYMRNTVELSGFLRDSVRCGNSVWIAQRNGRAKDGDDRTDPGLVRMIAASSPKEDPESLYGSLSIVPVSISYEIESCDCLRAVELFRKMSSQSYVKARHEDMNSILTGLMQPKGRIHVHISHEIDCGSIASEAATRGEFQKILSDEIDRSVWRGYRVFPISYAAHDMLSGTGRYADRYTKNDSGLLMERMRALSEMCESVNTEALSRILLGIYSKPIDNGCGE